MRIFTKVVLATENITSQHFVKCKQRFMHSSHARLKASLIDGIQRANKIQEQLRQEILLLTKQGFKSPQLTTVLVGDNYASLVYIKRKITAAAAVGISTNVVYLKSSITERELINIVKCLNDDTEVHGVLVQLPLPKHICERTICNLISPHKDVDGFNVVNMGRFVLGMETLWPCTAMAVRDLIQSTGIETKGKHVVVCGRSKNVGFPIATALHANGIDGGPGLNATTTICHRFTPPSQLKALTQSADILVSATGVPKLITSNMVKPGACVIDVGITRIIDQDSNKTHLTGDVDFEEVSNVAKFITPVPGGVGPMTVAMLLKNTLKAAVHQMKAPLF